MPMAESARELVVSLGLRASSSSRSIFSSSKSVTNRRKREFSSSSSEISWALIASFALRRCRLSVVTRNRSLAPSVQGHHAYPQFSGYLILHLALRGQLIGLREQSYYFGLRMLSVGHLSRLL